MHIDRVHAIDKTGGDKTEPSTTRARSTCCAADQGLRQRPGILDLRHGDPGVGGAGYLHDWPVEQYCRDSKIFSIYEGTNTSRRWTWSVAS
jgi:alkylation response protein AidB-like acyl-CoA dehydrogenase